MGKTKKASSEKGVKNKSTSGQSSSSTESEGDDSEIGLTVSSGRNSGGRGSRGGTIRHVYTANNDMECIEEYLKPTYKDGDVILDVECGANKAQMYLSKLCQGSKGPCVHFQESWLTPNEFQYVSGRETAKDWKRSIRHQGKSMKLLLTKGVLSVHSTVCDCEGCRVTSPVNRCRLAEKRRSVYSTTRKERLTLESFTSVDTLSQEATKPEPEVEDRAEENVSNDDQEKNDVEEPKQKSLKNCSPLRESRLSNIIEQLRTSKEKETTTDDEEKVKIENYSNDEKSTKDENGNENKAEVDGMGEDNVMEEEDDTDIEVDTGSAELPTTEPVDEKTSEEEKDEGINCLEESADSEDNVDVSDEAEVTNETESEPEKVEEHDKGETEPIPEATAEPVDLDTGTELTDAASDAEAPEEKTEVIKTIQETEATRTSPESIDSNRADIKEQPPTADDRKTESSKTTRKEETDKISNMETKDEDVQRESPRVSAPRVSLCGDSQLKSPTTDKIFKESRRHHSPPSQYNTDQAVKRLSPTAPAQSVLMPVSCPTALPASIPEQLPFMDMNGVKYSDYIRLLAASHLGGHIPMLQERLLSDNFHALPLAANMGALTHPFPAYPFFAPHLPMKDPSLFPSGQIPMPMGTPFLPPYIYQHRPYGMLPPNTLDMGKLGYFSQVPETMKAASCNSVSDMERKRHSSELDSALDLSTKKLKFDGTKVASTSSTSSSGNNRIKSGSKISTMCKDKKQSPNKSERHSANHVIKTSSNQLTDLNSGKYTEFKNHNSLDRKSNYRLGECMCSSSRKDDIRSWTVQEVCAFLKTLDGCSIYSDNFREHRVDGKSLPLLTIEHLMRNIGMKLGPAVLLTEAVTRRLKLSKLGNRKCPKCEGKQT